MIKGHDIIVVGAFGWGGVESLKRMVHGFKRDLPASLIVVLHLPETIKVSLPKILARADSLPAGHPNDGELIGPGKNLRRSRLITIAVAGRSCFGSPGAQRKTLFGRLSIVLFRSAARTYGPRRRVVFVLSGLLDDGTAGLWTIKQP